MRWLLLPLFASVAQAAPTPKRCPETPTLVRIVSENAQTVKSRFEMMSSLPYEIQVEDFGTETELSIGYRCPTQQDQFYEPGSLKLLGRVTRMLLPQAKALGIRSIRLDFRKDP